MIAATNPLLLRMSAKEPKNIIVFSTFLYFIAPLSMVVATADYETKKADHLVFYKGEKIRVYERYITPPFGKFWVGEVLDVEVR